MINRPRVHSMTGLRTKTRTDGKWSTGRSSVAKRCAYAACNREMVCEGKQTYCSYACLSATRRVAPIATAPEWRCERFVELDRLIEMGERNA